MNGHDLEVVDGVAAGGWIQPEMTGPGGSVTGTVPARFEAYVRILHPAMDVEGNPVSWRQVADELSRAVHPLAQWDAIVGANRYRQERPDWPGAEPVVGELPLDLLGVLCEVLERHTETAESCFFAVWTSRWEPATISSWAVIVDPEAELDPEDLKPPEPKPPAFTDEEMRRPTLDHGGGREYRVLSGPLSQATAAWKAIEPNESFPFTPHMIWPADRTWFLASEIDFDSTLVGGSEELVEAILATPALEAFPIGPRDLLTWDADRVNPPLREIDD